MISASITASSTSPQARDIFSALSDTTLAAPFDDSPIPVEDSPTTLAASSAASPTFLCSAWIIDPANSNSLAVFCTASCNSSCLPDVISIFGIPSSSLSENPRMASAAPLNLSPTKGSLEPISSNLPTIVAINSNCLRQMMVSLFRMPMMKLATLSVIFRIFPQIESQFLMTSGKTTIAKVVRIAMSAPTGFAAIAAVTSLIPAAINLNPANSWGRMRSIGPKTSMTAPRPAPTRISTFAKPSFSFIQFAIEISTGVMAATSAVIAGSKAWPNVTWASFIEACNPSIWLAKEPEVLIASP